MKPLLRIRTATLAGVTALACVVWPCGPAAVPAPAGAAPAIAWTLDNLSRVGGHPVTLVGAPRIVDTELGKAIEFDGAADGLFIERNPLAGLARFTVEALIAPAPDGPAEQRFLHFQETGSESRAMLETRMLPARTWCLDTFLRHDPASLTLIDRSAAHPSASWHAVALVYDGRKMAHYVDGVREMEGDLSLAPLREGRTSIGVRQNLQYWYKGRIRLVRITAEPLAVGRLLTAPAARAPGAPRG